MIVLGLTGSIAMGKSTAGAMLMRLGIPVHDSDAAVHEFLSSACEANTNVRAAFPYHTYPKVYDKKIKGGKYAGVRPLNRKALGKIVFSDDQKREELEGILHPYVQESQQSFIHAQKMLGKDIVALDIPLLFETDAEKRVDYVINVSAPAFIQRARVMARPNMNEEKLHAILARQLPDGEKSARADFVVHTGLGRAHTMRQLRKILLELQKCGPLEEKEKTS